MKKIYMALVAMLGLWQSSQAQDTLKLSLQQSIDLATKQNLELKSSLLDIDKANFKIKEITGTGLPQISGGVEFRNQIQLPVFVFPDPVSGEQKPIQVGTKYSTVGQLSLNQLIFDGSYFVGLKAAKEFRELAMQSHSKNERDLKVNVTKAYYLALISSQNLSLIQVNESTLENSLKETESLYKEGFVEQVDVDRIRLALNNLRVQKRKMEDGTEAGLMLLKVYLGIDPSSPIALTETIEALNETSQEPAFMGQTDAEQNRLELKLLQQQIEMNKLDLQRYKVQRYPSIRGFVNYQEQFFGNSLTFDPWFTTSLWGLSIGIPIFSSGVQSNKIKQARASVTQSQYIFDYAKSMYKMERLKLERDYQTSKQLAANQKENFELAQKIYNIASIKLKEGVGSNLELLNANQELRAAQTAYLESIYTLMLNKLNLQIATGQNL